MNRLQKVTRLLGVKASPVDETTTSETSSSNARGMIRKGAENRAQHHALLQIKTGLYSFSPVSEGLNESRKDKRVAKVNKD